jgi:hypothetical protein
MEEEKNPGNKRVEEQLELVQIAHHYGEAVVLSLVLVRILIIIK